PPSPGAAALRRLAELQPSVGKLVGDVEAVERAAMKTGLAELRAQRRDGNDTDQGSSASQFEASRAVPVVARSSGARAASSSLALDALPGRPDAAIGGLHASALIAGLITGLNDIFAPHLEVGANLDKSVTEKKGGATSTMSVEIGRADDGSTKLGLGFKTEASKSGVAAKSELAGKIDGQRCPNAEGQLPFTIKVRLGAESGGAVYSREVTAMVRAVVNDEANVESYTMDLTQGTRQVKDGVAVYIETATTMKEEGGNYTESNFRVIRHSQQATAKNAEPLSIAGLEAAFAAGLTALKIAEQSWQNGACTKIEAPSPGAVEPSSTTSIPVKVRHKFDGSEVPSKLDAALKGEASVDPTTLAKTSGTLTYTAPGETGKSATISLTATSRRGRATLDLTATTGGASYQIVGGLDDWQTNTKVCDIMKPFTLTGGGFTMQVSGGLSGTYTYTGPFNAHGGESYTISLPDGLGKPGTMTGGGVGCAGGKCKGGTEHYTLTPIPPCN
ncbi:MAG: hypothetical protein ND895_08515, partial [Pyrinomonadaceae bacterium]|nr:hypothetical protein [Pyrinomonadaceae bacterium]